MQGGKPMVQGGKPLDCVAPASHPIDCSCSQTPEAGATGDIEKWWREKGEEETEKGQENKISRKNVRRENTESD